MTGDDMTLADWRSEAEINRITLGLFASLVLEMRSAQKSHGWALNTQRPWKSVNELECMVDEWLACYAAGKGK